MIDIKAILGIASTAAGVVALVLSKTGQQHAADTVTACVDTANHLGTDAISVCKQAAHETASATKIIVGGFLTTLGSYLNLIGKLKK